MSPIEGSRGLVGGDIEKFWEINLCEVGDFQSCLYSYCCLQCAIGQGKSQLDDSNWYVACCMFNPCSARWLVRTAYDIQGSALNDCLLGTFCPCCTVNQILQTTKARGNPNSGEFGPTYNIGPLHGSREDVLRKTDSFSSCCYATWCTPCAVASSLHESIGMPWCFAFWCLNPFAALNIIRYQYRLEGNEFLWDCAVPVGYFVTIETISAIIVGTMKTHAYGWIFDLAFIIPGMFYAYYAYEEVKARQMQGEVFKPAVAGEEGKYLGQYGNHQYLVV